MAKMITIAVGVNRRVVEYWNYFMDDDTDVDALMDKLKKNKLGLDDLPNGKCLEEEAESEDIVSYDLWCVDENT